MDTRGFQRQIARLESKVDLLQSELVYLDQLLHRCGFPEGIETLKGAALELLEEMDSSPQKHN